MSLLHIAGGATEDKLYVEDVFASYLRTGTGADVTVPTNIDMTKGYMVWTKGRSGGTDNAIYDSARGVTKDLVTNSTAAQTTQATGLKAVSTTGHTIGSLAKMNTSGATYVDWVFKKAPKFFDIVTYTGNGVAGRQIPHNLGCEVGMMIVKGTNATSTDWAVYHKSHGNIGGAQLNMTTAFFTQSGWWNNTTPTSNSFTVGTNYSVNTLGTTYVAYLYAHDTSADGIIQCGSFTTDGDGNASVNLGWEPQFVLYKGADITGDNWKMVDTSRGMPVVNTGNPTPALSANLASAEVNIGWIYPTATGLSTGNQVALKTYIYLAIRRPNKPPTSGTQVYNAITSSAAANTVLTTGFPIDLQINAQRNASMTDNSTFMDRLRGLAIIGSVAYTNQELYSSSSNKEVGRTNSTENFSNTGFSIGSGRNGEPTIYHSFKRAKGFFDIVCYTGTGVARTVNHNLGVVPELLIIKSRSAAGDWQVWFNGLSATEKLVLNTTAAKVTDATLLNSTLPTSTAFTLGSGRYTNTSGNTYIAYLFATLAGISKVGSYTGNGTSQTINCGFSTGARFILIKRTDSTGDWYIWDSVRGIVAANDPYLSLNTIAAEVTTDDSIDPDSSGFIVNQNTETNINVNGGSYIFLAIA